MPSTVPNGGQRAIQALLVTPAQQARALAQQQQGGVAGTIPGTVDSPPPGALATVALRTGAMFPYPPDAPSPNGDRVAGVGHHAVIPVVVDGTTIDAPVVMLGNLQLTQSGNPYSDRNVALLDQHGNVIAWHSPTDGPQQVILTNPQPGNYTFTIHDIAKTVESESASACTFTIPTLADSGIPLGGWIEVCQIGAGTLTIATASGVTLLPSGASGPARQGATISLRQRQTADQWVLTGEYR